MSATEVDAGIGADLEVGPERRTSPVELLWDLVFVFAVTQVATLLGRHLTWAAFGKGMLILALMWWAWSAFVWATNAQDPDAPGFRAAMLLATALIFLAGVALPGAFGPDAVLFAVTYALVRLIHLAIYVDASQRGNASLRAIGGFAFTVVIGMVLLLAGALASETARIVLWTVAAAIDYAGPAWLTRERLRGLQQVAVAHFAERYGLFVLICLGESVVDIGLGADGRPLDAETVTAILLALCITIGLWWTYFGCVADAAQERLARHDDPVLAAADGYSYLHLLIVAGIIIFAVGAKIAVAHAAHPLSTAAALTLCGGVALFLVGHAAFRLRMLRVVAWPELAAAAACALPLALAADHPATLTAGALTIVLAALVGYEMVAPQGALQVLRAR